MLERIKTEVIGYISKVQIRAEADVEKVEEQRRQQAPMQFQHAQASALAADETAGESAAAGEAEQAAPFVRTGRKVGRNEPCPCGSGKKYKQCHGRLEH